MLAIKVKDPATFTVAVKPFPLFTWLVRKEYLKEAELFYIVHFPSEKSHDLEFAVGRKYAEQGIVWHDMMEELLIIERLDLLCDISVYIGIDEYSVKYRLDTYPGSSGSPLLYSAGGGIKCVVLMAVHVRGDVENRCYNVGSVLNKSFLSEVEKLMK